MRRLFLILLLIVSVCFWGCESRESTPPQMQAGNTETTEKVSADIPPKTARFLQEPLQATVVEHPAEALPVWRRHRDAKPTLVLLSNDPFLEPIPGGVAEDALRLTAQGSAASITAKTDPRAPDLLLRPSMSLSAASQAGFFHKVVWLLPVYAEEEELSVETFRRLILQYGAVSEEEAATFELEGQMFRGVVRGIPWEVTPVQLFTGTSEPALIHLDLSFFHDLYRGEIKTPLHPLVYQVLRQLRGSAQETLGVTISLSNVTEKVSLQVRFLGDLLARLVGEPERLDQPLAQNDFRRHEALHLADFFQKEKRRELYLAMETAAPENASVKYDLFLMASEFKEGEKALQHLAEAVAIDPLYALEYLHLAELALLKNRPDAAVEMLDHASAVFPENPFILLRKTDILLETKNREAAVTLLEKSLALPWSKIYHPNMQAKIRARLEVPEKPSAIQPSQ